MLEVEEPLAMGEGQYTEENNMMEEEDGKQGMEGEGERCGEKKKSKGEGETPKKLIACPMCKGKGYFERSKKTELIKQIRQEINSEEKQSTQEYSGTLPAIAQDQKPYYPVEQLFRASDNRTLSRVSDSAVSSSHMTVLKAQTRLPPVNPHVSATNHASAGKVKSTPGNLSQTSDHFSIERKYEKHPDELARLAVIKLNRSDWETKKAGLNDCLMLAEKYPEDLEPHMSLVYRTLSSLMHGFHPQITAFVCHAACVFFECMHAICRPEYDELMYSLLARTADKNKTIRHYANKALDHAVTYIATIHAVRPIVEKGPIHNNPLVRTATARLLTCVVEMKTPNVILTNPHFRETCKRIIETGAILLADSNIDVRAAAKTLISKFMAEEEFESMYYAEVDEKLRKRVERAFFDIKARVHGSA